MIIAAFWPLKAEESGAGGSERTAGELGRIVAASGHGLLLISGRGASRRAAGAYREARGMRLIGLFPSEEAEPASGLFDELHRIRGPEDLHERVFELSDAILCMESPPPSLPSGPLDESPGKSLFVIASSRGDEASASPKPPWRSLPDVAAFARELARDFSRRIVSRPDPMSAQRRRKDPF